MSVHDLYVGATSIKGLSGMLVADWGPLYDVDVFRGEDKTIPGLPGVVGVEPVRDYYDFVIEFNLAGSTDAELVARIGTLRALFAATALVTLTRRLPLAGSPFYVDTSCNGKYLGLRWTDTTNPLDIGGVLQFRNLDGAWA